MSHLSTIYNIHKLNGYIFSYTLKARRYAYMPPVNKWVLKLYYYKWIRKWLVMMVKPWLLPLPNNAQKKLTFSFLFNKKK